MSGYTEKLTEIGKIDETDKEILLTREDRRMLCILLNTEISTQQHKMNNVDGDVRRQYRIDLLTGIFDKLKV